MAYTPTHITFKIDTTQLHEEVIRLIAEIEKLKPIEVPPNQPPLFEE